MTEHPKKRVGRGRGEKHLSRAAMLTNCIRSEYEEKSSETSSEVSVVRITSVLVCEVSFNAGSNLV